MLERIDRYELKERIGAGGQATVYLGEDTLLKRTVAVKVLNQLASVEGAYVDAIMHEARLAAGLNHPNIATVYDFKVDGDYACIVMQYFPNSLDGEIRNRGPMSPDRAVRTWDTGMTWREFNYAYYKATVELGGIIDDPRGLVFANARGSDPLVTLHSGLENYVIEPGMNIMFDCHGTWNMYCWDGGKTWIVDGEPWSKAAEAAKATKAAVRELENAMRPGVTVIELQVKTRRVFKDFDIRPDSVYIFFHGLGLSHTDLEQHIEEGKPYPDWPIEGGMVLATHLLYPSGDHDRYWAEDVVVVRQDGAESLYTWEFDLITGRGG